MWQLSNSGKNRIDMTEITLGVIGGTGLYQMEALEIVEEREVATPFGAPSDAFTIGRIHGALVAFLPRHGKGHRILPNELNFRANLWAMKKLGVEQIVSVSAVGSLKSEYRPKDLLIPDQFIDRTRHRVDTFFGEGLVAHVAFADPVCSGLAAIIASAADTTEATVHRGGTYVCMEGPQFSTRAESHLYRSWGADVIGMTNLQEAKLAREAEICYATLALVTDYDCWHEEEADVDGAAILEVLRQNSEVAQQVLATTLESLASGAQGSASGAQGFASGAQGSCSCRRALETALVTAPDLVPEETYDRLEILIGKYMPRRS